MNTAKNNIEYQIKKQIKEREVAPSRDLWSEIELQKENKQVTSYMSWILAAACLVLTFGLGFVIFSNSSDREKSQNKEMTEVKNIPTQEKPFEEDVRKDQQSMYTYKMAAPERKDVSTKVINDVESSNVLAEQKYILPKKESAQVIVPQIPQIRSEKIIAQADSSKIPAKRKRYVDPSTLLFSVEHKDVIEKTKESNVASVNLNGK